jgi:hypothetical protein
MDTYARGEEPVEWICETPIKFWIHKRRRNSRLAERSISLYNSKIVDKKKILPTLSNTSIYCSSDKIGTVYLV